jgi:DHA2 family multidrug resistance protein
MPDFFGLALLAAGLGGLYVLLYRGQREGWFDSQTIRALLPAVVVGIPLFLWHQHRTGSLLTWQSLRHRGVAAGIFFSFFVGVIVYGGLYLLPQFLRAVGRHDALGTGELTFIDAVATLTGIFVCSVGVNFARTRTWLFLSGTLFTTSMVLFATRQTSATPDEALYLPLALRGLSVGFLLVPAAMFTFRSVSSANHGHAAEARGLYYMTRQLGGAIGVAVIAAMVDYRGSVHSGQLGEHLAAVNPAVGRAVSTLAGGTVGHGMAPALAGRAAHVLLDRMVVREATVLAFQDVFFLLAAVGVAVCLLTPLFPRMRDGRKKRAAPADASSDDRRNAAWAASMAAAAS